MKSLAIRCLVLFVAAFAFTLAEQRQVETSPDVVGINGTLNSVPGYPAGTKLKYRVGAVKTGDSAGKTAHFWLKLENPNAFPVNVVVCAMLTLHNKPHITVPRTVVGKNSANEWECQTSGTSVQPRNYHFSCKRVTVPANSNIDVFDQAVEFSVPFEAKDLGAVYFDVLKDCPLKNCHIAKGPDGWVVPQAPQQHQDWVNIWASGQSYHDLSAGGFSSASWPSGNWVTMGYPAVYPARLRGIVTGAVAGTVIEVSLGGAVRERFVVPPDRERRPCDGRDVPIDLIFQIPADDVLDRITITLPNNECGFVPEGAVVRFSAEITAEAGAPFYQPGDFMHSVDIVFVKDTRPPRISSVRAREISPGTLRLDVAAIDDTTMAMGATLVYSVDRQDATEVPIDYADPASEGDVMLFSDVFRGLPVGVLITYHVDVYDELGNRASSPRESIVLSRPTLPKPSLRLPVDEFTMSDMGPISLSWTNPSGTSQYQIQVVPANNDGPGVNLIRVAETQFTVLPPVFGRGPYVLLPGATYSWRIRAIDTAEAVMEDDLRWGPWSDARTFQTPRPSSATISLRPVGPDNTTSNTTPTLRWDDSNASVFYYEVQLSADPRFNLDPGTATASVYWNLVHGGVSTPPNSWTVPEKAALETERTYYWRVRPRLQATLFGFAEPGVEWTAPAPFKVTRGGL